MECPLCGSEFIGKHEPSEVEVDSTDGYVLTMKRYIHYHDEVETIGCFVIRKEKITIK
uniref:Uncharacterized protein n=1 Tax=viral metagenome TaxID=1070528 RepID=A0A6H2A1I4_9ZZZZ